MPIFERHIVTRGYEPDRTATVGLVRILNYLEQLRWEFVQSQEAGLTEHLAKGHFPVLRAQRVELVQRVAMNVELKLTARIRKVGRNLVAIEHHVVNRQDNTLVAYAVVDGIFLGPTRSLVRIPAEFKALGKEHAALPSVVHAFADCEGRPSEGPLVHTAPHHHVYAPLGLEDLSHQDPQKSVPFELTMRVRPSQIDIFNHVNAATYVEIFTDALYEASQAMPGIFGEHENTLLRRVAIHYGAEALVRQELRIRLWPLPGNQRVGCELYRAQDDTSLCLATLHMVDTQERASLSHAQEDPSQNAIASEKTYLAFS